MCQWIQSGTKLDWNKRYDWRYSKYDRFRRYWYQNTKYDILKTNIEDNDKDWDKKYIWIEGEIDEYKNTEVTN